MKLQNEYLTIEIQERGGSLISIFDKRRNKELLYQPKEDAWQGQDVFIFPFIGRLIKKTYTINRKTYSFENHGLLRYMDASLSSGENYLLAQFVSNQDTLKRYPFHFKASLKYTLENNLVHLNYTILNESNEVMPFMLGAHPAFALPGERNENEFDMSGNTISFDGDKEKDVLLQEKTFSYMTGRWAKIDAPISLTKGLFNMINTIIIDSSETNEVYLNKKDGSLLTIITNNCPYIAIWSDKKWGDYVCIEPWFGYPDTLNSSKELKEKPGIQLLSPHDKFTYEYQIKVD